MARTGARKFAYRSMLQVRPVQVVGSRQKHEKSKGHLFLPV